MIDHKGIAIKFLILFMLCMECNIPSVLADGEIRCIEREREALLRFKQGLVDDYGILSSWGSEDDKKECCKWERVRCSNTTGHVTGLPLHGDWSDDRNSFYGIRGKVSSALLELHHLNYLNLSYNDFGGDGVPEFIGSIKSLETLHLRYSNFSGTIPPQLGNLTNLRDLDLSYNDFGGDRIPEFIGSIKSLETLHLSDSKFSGTVPPQLGNLTNLRDLDLRGNDFGGDRVPEFIGSIKSLERLYLASSNFSGIVPPQLGNLSNLQDLDLGDNVGLRFENLNWLSHLFLLSRFDLSWNDLSNTNWLKPILKLHSLQELYLSHSSIGDVMPPSGPFVNSSFTSLSALDLSYNEFTSSTIDWLFNTSTSLVSIDLSYNKLDRIPRSLEILSHLEILSLAYNDLGGRLDELFGNQSAKGTVSLESHANLSSNQLTRSMQDLRTLSTLRELHLGSNKLTGPVPLSLGQLSELEVLDISFNSLEGIISEANFMRLHNLTYLDLSFNSFTMQIAPDWSPPFQLSGIFLARCNVGPHFPKWIQTQSNLRSLDLSCNGISGEIPKLLWSFSPQLSHLNLSSNQISGTIPDLSSTSIQIIDVSSNKISGPIPLFSPKIRLVWFSQNMFSGSISSICNTISYGSLELLDLSNNQLAQELPMCWKKMTSLEYLNLAHNSFSGEIPDALGTLQYLEALHLRDNNLTGELPSTLKNCQYLELFDIGRNKLTGNIPAWIGENYTYMAILILRDNRFYGGIPSEICNLTQIQVLDLSENSISGGIPQCFSKFASLAEKSAAAHLIGTGYAVGTYASKDFIEYALVQWKGQESEYSRELGLLKLIDLSSNKLVGSIPRSISSLRGLISLNLSRNSLTGNIIPDIGQMEMLEVLDLSGNQLSGEIPIGLAQLHFLDVLDLANNNLTGEIPLSTQLQSFNASVYAGNNGLCGRPLPLCLNTSITNEEENMKKKDGGRMSLSGLQESCISAVLGFIVGFWGVIGSLVLKKSWRSAYFNLLDAVGDWIYVTTALLFSKFRRSC